MAAAQPEQSSDFFVQYKEAADTVDEALIKEWDSSADVLLVFAGLFSAVSTAFITESYKRMQPDFTELSYYALRNATPPYTPDTFVVTTSVRTVNGLWIASLIVSLLTAVIAILAKQWLRNYPVLNRGSLRNWVLLRQFRHDGASQWRFTEIFSLLPALLHLSLFLFLIGLVVFLYTIDVQIAQMTLGLLIVVVVLYTAAIGTPSFSSTTPFRSMLSDSLEDAYLAVANAVQFLLRMRTQPRHSESPWVRIPDQMAGTCLEAALVWLCKWRDTPSIVYSVLETLDAERLSVTAPPLLDYIRSMTRAGLAGAVPGGIPSYRLPLYIRLARNHLSSAELLTLLHNARLCGVVNSALTRGLELTADVLSEVTASLHVIRRKEGDLVTVPLLHDLLYDIGTGNQANSSSTLGVVLLAAFSDGDRNVSRTAQMFADIVSLKDIDPSDQFWSSLANEINTSLTNDQRQALQASDRTCFEDLLKALEKFYSSVGFDPDSPHVASTLLPANSFVGVSTLTQQPAQPNNAA